MHFYTEGMDKYYAKILSAERLRRCYKIAPPVVQQYFKAEMEYVIKQLNTNSIVLELGCGYGRVLSGLAAHSKFVYGIDTSFDSLLMAKDELRRISNFNILCMDAAKTGFKDNIFDTVICIQNGISAFKANPLELVSESIRITKQGGKLLFSSYSDNFWDERLGWFEAQADEGLIGEIDYDATGNGVIVCKDGFKATTFGITEFELLADKLGLRAHIIEVDNSSIFCEIIVE